MFTLLSRIMGFIRDMVIARGFGAGMGSDAFFVALKLPNFLRRLTAEGAFNAAFVPVFNDYRVNTSRVETAQVVATIFTLMATILVLLVVLAEWFMPGLIFLTTPGFQDQPDKLALTVSLTRITFPYIFFISLVALAGGILNSYNRFTVPAVSPVLLNLCLIGGALWLAPLFDEPTMGLAWGVFLGGVAQLAIQLPALVRLGMPFRWRWAPHHVAVGRVLKLMGPSVLGASVAQINLLFDLFLASWLAEGSISYLYYADRLVEFPLGVIGIALGTAVLPAFSTRAARNDLEGLKHELDFALRLMVTITLPATVGLILLRVPILALLFERGAFDAHTTQQAARALLAYGLGLMAFSGVKLLTPAYFALQDTRTPVRIAIIALVANMVMNLMLIWPMQHAGLALATTLAAWLNVVLLYRRLDARLDFRLGRAFVMTVLKTAGACVVMGLFLEGMLALFWQPGLTTLERVLVLCPLILGGGVLFLAAGWILGLTELRELLGALRRRKRTTPTP
jgi:putative peptidoglycan lipid II flippase